MGHPLAWGQQRLALEGHGGTGARRLLFSIWEPDQQIPTKMFHKQRGVWLFFFFFSFFVMFCRTVFGCLGASGLLAPLQLLLGGCISACASSQSVIHHRAKPHPFQREAGAQSPRGHTQCSLPWNLLRQQGRILPLGRQLCQNNKSSR